MLSKEQYESVVKELGELLYSYISRKYTSKIRECEVYMFQEDLYQTSILGDYLRSHNAIMLNYKKINSDQYTVAKVMCEQFTQATMHKLGIENITDKNSKEYNKLFKSIYLDICSSLHN